MFKINSFNLKKADSPKTDTNNNCETTNKSTSLERTPSNDTVNFKGAIASNNLQKEFIQKVLLGKDEIIEQTLKTYDFTKHGKNGICLKYPRHKFVEDIENIIKDMPEDTQIKNLGMFNMYKSQYDIEGIAQLPDEKEITTPSQKAIAHYVKKFTLQNESESDSKELKYTMDTIINGLGEFCVTIGKQQHPTHDYSVDIHTLKLLQNAMNNPLYNKLSDEGKLILKLSTFLHDLGKKGKVITKGHAAQSKVYAQDILKDFDFPQGTKDRITNTIENHHWFEAYNKGLSSTQEVLDIFKTQEEINIAKIMAKADFETINPTFHLDRMVNDTTLTQKEFDEIFAQKTSELNHQ